jgi:LmbE family N-acetylglucosaminyl deacetylase
LRTVQILKTPERGPVLAFAPHADDEVIGCGGTLSLHARQGDPVRIVVAFDGALGVDGDLSRQERAAIRRCEALAGGARLGLVDYGFLGFPEGHEPTQADIESSARRLAEEIHAVSPSTLYAPWEREQHIDHRSLHRAVRRALELLAEQGRSFRGRAFGYEVWTPLMPERIVDITPVLREKEQALAEHESQQKSVDLVRCALGLCAYRSLWIGAPALAGEAFAPLVDELWAGSSR